MKSFEFQRSINSQNLPLNLIGNLPLAHKGLRGKFPIRGKSVINDKVGLVWLIVDIQLSEDIGQSWR